MPNTELIPTNQENEIKNGTEEFYFTPVACIVASSIFYLPIWTISLFVSVCENVRFDKCLWLFFYISGYSVIEFTPIGWFSLIAGIIGFIGLILSPVNFKIKEKRFRAWVVFLLNLLFAIPSIPIVKTLILSCIT